MLIFMIENSSKEALLLKTEQNLVQNPVSVNLTAFHKYLMDQGRSVHTITSYMFGVRNYFRYYSELTPDNIRLYKAHLMDRYKPQTVNARIKALNCFLKFQGIQDYKARILKIQSKKYTEHVISQADYEYFKKRLLAEEQFTFYYLVRLITATGVRVSEVVAFDVEDVVCGYKELRSKGNKLRRVYIPTALQRKLLKWLKQENRNSGPLFLSHLGKRISISGVRTQLKTLGCRCGLDPEVVYPHSFRHRFAKNFIENGGDISFLSDLLGHDSIETTRIYLRRTSTEQALIFNRVVNW